MSQLQVVLSFCFGTKSALPQITLVEQGPKWVACRPEHRAGNLPLAELAATSPDSGRSECVLRVDCYPLAWILK